MERNILKEFLVSLGFEVDDSQYQAASKKVKAFEEKAAKTVEAIGKNAEKGAKVTVAALGSMTAGIAAYVAGVTKADLETEKFARRMWMTEEDARSLQNTLSAMGESMDSIYDVAANPELWARFFQLRTDAAQLEGGAEIDEGLKKLRDVQFEFQRLNLLLSYLGRYIAYYLSKYLAGPLSQIQAKLKSINDNGRSVVEDWGAKAAKVFSWILRLVLAGVEGAGDFLGMIERLPPEMQLAMAAIAALGFAALNPFTLMIAAIGAVLLLLDDFYTWKRGGKSLLGDTWSQLDQLDFGSKSFQSIQRLLGNIGNLFDTLGEKWKNLNETVKEKTGFTILENALLGVDTVVCTIADGLAFIVELLDKILKDEPPQWLKTLLYAMNGTTEAAELERLERYGGKTQSEKTEKAERKSTVQWNPFLWLGALQDVKQQKQFTLPIVAGPTTPAEQVKQAVTNDNRKEINQENKAEMNNTFVVNGTDATAIAYGVASQLQQTVLNQFSGGWFNNAVKIPE